MMQDIRALLRNTQVVSPLVVASHRREISMKTRIVAGALLVVGALGVVMPQSQAQAFSAQNFHGSICQVNSVSLPNVSYSEFGIRANSTVFVRCPLMTVSREVVSINVNVQDTTLPGTLCTVSAKLFTGADQVPDMPLEIPSGQPAASVVIPAAGKGPTTTYHVRCRLPQGQTLTSLNVVLEP